MRRLPNFVVLLVCALWPAAQPAGLPHPAMAIASSEQGVAMEPLAIVVNRSNPVDDLSSSELRAIFLGSRGHWPSGRRVTLVMREIDDPGREVILREICGMT